MAFVNRWWQWFLVLVAGLIVVTYLPPRQPSDRYGLREDWQGYPTPEGRLAKRLGDDYERASERARIRAVRDSLLRILARQGVRPGAVAILAPTPALDSAARAIARAATPSVPALSPEVRIALALVPSGPRDWGASSNAYLPLATDGRTCISSFAVAMHDPSSRGVRRPTEALGPCAFFAAFGLPGPGIARWLESRGYSFALESDWRVTSHAFPHPPRRDAASWVRGEIAHLGGMSAAEDYEPGPYWGAFALAGCSAGKLDACRRYFFVDVDGHSTSIPGVIGYRPYFVQSSYGVLATLVHDQGPERFARFWRSPLSPERAFDQAFTVPFSRWAPQWSRVYYGGNSFDATTRPREAVSTILWVGLCVAGCAGLALKRQVT